MTTRGLRLKDGIACFSASRYVEIVPAPILVVDDDDVLREGLEAFLSTRGFRTLAARNGAHALSILARNELPAVILLDLGMPVMGGEAFRTALLNDRRLATIPVVIITGNEVGAEVTEGLRPAALLRKPFSVTELDALLCRYV